MSIPGYEFCSDCCVFPADLRVFTQSAFTSAKSSFRTSFTAASSAVFFFLLTLLWPRSLSSRCCTECLLPCSSRWGIISCPVSLPRLSLLGRRLGVLLDFLWIFLVGGVGGVLCPLLVALSAWLGLFCLCDSA
eukprot:IDg6679t1